MSASQPMTVSKWRYYLTFGLLSVALGTLCARLVLLLSRGPSDLVESAIRQQRTVTIFPARPGSILATSRRAYVPLAVSRQVPSCYADPLILSDEIDEIAPQIAAALEIPLTAVQSKLREHGTRRFCWMKRAVSDSQAESIRGLKNRGVRIRHEWAREYPNGDLAATVVGFRRIGGFPGAGIELTQDEHIAPCDGRTVLLSDASRRGIHPIGGQTIPPRDGANVFLTLDAVMQGYLHDAVRASVEKFSGHWGTGIIVEPHTGRILGMCSYPSFDPNAYNTARPEDMANRAISLPFEPGSVLKPIIAAGAVQAGVVRYQDEIFCENGTYRARKGGRITDHGKSYQWLSVTDGVVFSSNICMAKVGEKLGNEMMHHIVKSFGFGRTTGIELTGESPGIVRPLKKWNGYSLRRVPFGQEISVTALQLAMSFATIANGGELLRPRLVDRVVDSEGRVVYRSERQVVRRVISESVAKETLKVMSEVVTRGTGRACRIEGYTVFGKTGTAQVAGPGGYEPDAYVSSFVGGGPLHDPRILILVSIYRPDPDKGYYGALVAAPPVREVLAKSLEYLGIRRDRTARLVSTEDPTIHSIH